MLTEIQALATKVHVVLHVRTETIESLAVLPFEVEIAAPCGTYGVATQHIHLLYITVGGMLYLARTLLIHHILYPSMLGTMRTVGIFSKQKPTRTVVERHYTCTTDTHFKAVGYYALISCTLGNLQRHVSTFLPNADTCPVVFELSVGRVLHTYNVCRDETDAQPSVCHVETQIVCCRGKHGNRRQ